MLSLLLPPRRRSPSALVPRRADDFLAWEAQQVDRHEFIEGRARRLSPCGDACAAVSGDIYLAVRWHLRAGGWRCWHRGTTLRVDDAFLYPDVMVSADPRDRDARDGRCAVAHPTLVVDVGPVPPAHASLDARSRLLQQLPGLREHARIDPWARTCAVWRRDAAGGWSAQRYEADQPLELASLDLWIEPATLFRPPA